MVIRFGYLVHLCVIVYEFGGQTRQIILCSNEQIYTHVRDVLNTLADLEMSELLG